jgi:hypothetical protein
MGICSLHNAWEWQRWAPAFFRAFPLASAKPKNRGSAKIKQREKSESAERERIQREFAFFPPLAA